jgi:hypothetical protein
MAKTKTTKDRISGEIHIPENLPEGLRFLYAEVENFKGLGSKIVHMDGKSLIIFGGNGESKSSLLQALQSSVDVKNLPPMPVKAGEEQAYFNIVVAGNEDGERKVYNIESYFSPATQEGRYIITNENGEKLPVSQKAMKQFFGDITIDPLYFINLGREGAAGKKKQIEILKKMTGKSDEINALNAQRTELDEQLKDVRQKIKIGETLVQNHGYSEADVKLYSKPQPIEDIEAELSEVGKSYKTWNDVNSGVQMRVDHIQTGKSIVEKSKAEIERLQKLIQEQEQRIHDTLQSIEKMEGEVIKGNQWLKSNLEPKTEEISQRLSSARLHNQHHEKLKEHGQKLLLVRKDKELESDLFLKRKDIDAAVRDVISKSQIPVEGLMFTEDEIFYDELPLVKGQINDAKLNEIGVKIAVAMKPKLRAIFIENGSTLDKNTLKAIVESAPGYQFLVEYVKFDGGEMEVKFIEEVLR